MTRLRQGKGPQLRLIRSAEMPKAPLEKGLIQAIRDGLSRMGITNWSGRIFVHNHKPPYLPTLGAGTPDVIGVLPSGKMFGIEGKRGEADKPSDVQLWWHACARATGVQVYVARDVEGALRWVEALRRIG